MVWLLSVMQADHLYRFSRDEVQIQWVFLRGKMASLYQYSERLRQGAANCTASEEDAYVQATAQMAAMSEGEHQHGVCSESKQLLFCVGVVGDQWSWEG
jgi:hypothetical protein